MAMTDNEMRRLATYFAEAMQNSGVGRGSRNTFIDKSTRSGSKSPERSKTVISDLDETLTTSFKDTIKRWRDAARETTRMIKGSALRDAHDSYIEGLNELSKKSNEASSKITRAFTEIIEANKGNHAIQQKAYNAVAAYTEALSNLTKKTADESQDNTKRGEIRGLKKIVDNEAKALEELGISVENTTMVYNRSTKNYELQNRENLNSIIETNQKILDEAEEYADDLKRTHKRELEARDQYVKALGKAIVSGIFTTVKTVDGRLKNLQSETDYSMTFDGMSADEINAWHNANRRTQKFLGDAGKDFYDGTQDALNSLGYFGAELRQMQTVMGNALMDSGIAPSKAAGDELGQIVAEVQALQNVTRDEAVQIVTANMESVAFAVGSRGKTDAEQLKLLKEQVVESRKTSMGIGLSNKYLDDQLQQQTNLRYGSVIEKIKATAIGNPFIKEIERYTGQKVSDEDKILFNRNLVGGLAGDNDAIVKYNTGIGKTIQGVLSSIARQSTEDAAKLNPNIGTAGVTIESLAAEIPLDRVALAQEQDRADVVKETRGKAVENIDLVQTVDDSKKSLNEFEKAARKATVALEGIAKSPAGEAAGAVGGIASQYLQFKATDMILGKGGKLLGKVGEKLGVGNLISKILPKGAGGGILSRIKNVFPRVAPVAVETATGSTTKTGLFAAAKNVFSGGLSKAGGIATALKTAPNLFRGGLNAAKDFGLSAISSPKNFTTSAYKIGKGAIKGFVPLTAGISAAESIYDVATTSTEDYASRYGLKTPTSFGGDVTLRSAGGLADIGNNLMESFTFGTLNGEKIATAIGPSIGDAIGSGINSVLKLFGGGVDDSAYKKLKEDMTQGRVLDENGILRPDDQAKTQKILEDIAKNTAKTVETVKQSNVERKDDEVKKTAQSAYAEKTRNSVNAMIEQRTASLRQAAEVAKSKAYNNMDSALGA